MKTKIKFILVVLQNMYSGSGVDRQAPLVFKMNQRNKSGKVMLSICSSDKPNRAVWFSNCSSIYSGGGPNSKGETDEDYMREVMNLRNWDLVIFGGNQSKKAYKDFFNNVDKQVILMPHPASRNLSNNLKNIAKKFVDSNKSVELIQLKDKKVKVKML